MTPETNLARERTRFRVLSALSDKELTSTELLKASKVSKNTLSKTLNELKKRRQFMNL